MRVPVWLPIVMAGVASGWTVPGMAQDSPARIHHDHAGDGHAVTDGQAVDGQWGHGHAQNHDWYKDLKQPGTDYSCCNGDAVNGDCRPTRAYKESDGTWRALVDGHWQPVPPSVVLKILAPDGNSHICAGKSGMIYCFIGGVPKS